ncbi:MAG TPA: GatB/YqeY domain-containing protein [Steroidobacteraceae bacterium]
MTLKARIQEDMKSAMRAGAKDKLANIRMLMAAIKQREVDERIELDDAQVLSVIDKMVKQRRESIAQFEAGGRGDLVARETAEMQLLSAYLPAQLSAAELDAMIAEVIAATGASSIKDMGKVMAAIKARAAGRADMGAVGARIKARLSA